MLGVETAVHVNEHNLQKTHRDTNKKRYPLSSRLREKLFEVDEAEVGEHPSSDDEDSNVDNDEESICELEPPAKSSLKNHFLDLRDLIDSGFNIVPVAESASLVGEVDVVQDGLQWKLGGTMQPPLNVSKNVSSKLKVGMTQHFNTPLSSFLSFVPMDFWKLWLYETNRYGTQKLLQQENTIGAFKPIALQEFMTFFGIQ